MATVLSLCSMLLPAIIAGTQSEVRECAFSDHLPQHRAGPQRPADERDNTTVRCSRGLSCFGLWEQRPGGEVLLIKQGCWTSQPDCLSDHCLVTAPPAHILKGSYRFCCCSRNLCNAYFREAPPTAAPPVHKVPDGGGLQRNTYALVAVGTIAVAVIAVALLYCGYTLLTGKSSSSVNVLETTGTPCGDMDDLRLWELIGLGRFASVYRGSLKDHTVAVKVFSSAQWQKFANQRAVYRLPLVRQQHDLACFLSAHQRSDGEGGIQHLIVMDYYPNGCLSHFLSHSCLDWASCCRMMLGVTRGLSFLHSEVQAGDQSKPAVAHRDVSSSNVLVRSDLSCVLSGFSLSMSLSRDPSGGHGDPGTVAISEAGALRYRAPELLSGALDLREYGTALKQVDVYALGLLLWESFRRCHDMFPGRASPHFELAFEAELGLEPRLEDMHELVCREKYRPQFPPEWKYNSPMSRLVKETIEDCWDQDAEARLSAQCAEERLSQLSLFSGPTALTPRMNGAHLFQDQPVSSTSRSQTEPQMPQQQDLLQRPSSLQLPTVPSREEQRGLKPRESQGPPPITNLSKERPGVPQITAQLRDKHGALMSRERQVETGIAKMTVTMPTNRRAVMMADGSSAGAPTLVTNRLMARGLINRAGQQLEDLSRSSNELASLEQEPSLNFWSPDEDQPLLKNEVPPAEAILSMQHTNANNNNNYSSHREQWITKRAGHSDCSGHSGSSKCTSIPARIQHLLEDLYKPESNETIDMLNCPSSVQLVGLKPDCKDEVSMSMYESQENTVILMNSSKDTTDNWVNSQTSDDVHSGTVRNVSELSYPSSPVPLPQMSSEHPSGRCLSPVSLARVPTQAPLPHSSSDLVQSTQSPHRDRHPPRPCSLDLSSPSRITDGAPLTDSGLTASGEKIRRRVKTPYTVKKWRPSSWVPPADHHPALLLQSFPNCPSIIQSESSPAVFLLRDNRGKSTRSSCPDGLTSF